ncbi:hypothetical protein Pyn_18347 [Prunus yedoensis var. nudiflora]|uniref:Berberine/berberine-like domain-containing protein n=1 Tax=Prunus yedoensis var. nudiflora TaxID=2094558 RepID=A0A314UK54_PRUYE|nr:hypothetical protein Pyn_18347 [Prunus yedoensis var. nudiflora]
MGVGGHISGGGFGTIFRKYEFSAENPWEKNSYGHQRRMRLELCSHSGHRRRIANEAGATDGKTIKVSFDSLFLGPVEKLLLLMQDKFPDLSLDHSNCTEMSWIQSVMYFAGFPISEYLEVLLKRTQPSRSFFKAKSDNVTQPISQACLEGLWQRLLEVETSQLILTPYGGRMSEISDSETPLPHRNGSIFAIQYLVTWDDDKETEKHISWMRRVYAYMASHVSKSPRAAYLNYRDLDLGRNHDANTSYAQASIWGLKYFKSNFRRLVHVKTLVDPGNFFRNEQSIPVLPSGQK